MPGVISGARLARTRFGSVSRCEPELCAARRREAGLLRNDKRKK